MQRAQFTVHGEKRGLGFGIVKHGDLEFIGHGGGYPGFITRSGLNQKHKLIVVVLTNAVDGPALTFSMGIAKIISHVIKKEEKLKIKTTEEIINFAKIRGFYASDWGTSFYSSISNKLIEINPSLDNPTEYFLIYKHQGNYNFKTPGKPMYGSPDEIIRFIEDPKGEIVVLDAGAEIKPFHYSY